MNVLFGALLKSPLLWACVLILALGAALKVRSGQVQDLREDLKITDLALKELKAEHCRTRGELASALAANLVYALAEQRRQDEAAAFAAEQARIQAELKRLLAVTRAERDDADRTFRAFVDQFKAAPESCHVATRQMEAACAALSDY